jgi:hypothetical protein
MTKTLYEEYAVVESKMKQLALQKEQLRGLILDQMEKKGEDKVQTPVGSFTVAKLKTWVYPDKVVALGEDFKAAKATAESTGDATYTETPSLRFTQIKL